MKLSKKGLEKHPVFQKKASFSMVQGLIIALVILLILLLGIGRFMEMTKDKLPKEICQQSVKQAASQHSFGMDFSEELKCPVQYVIIEKNQEIIPELANYTKDCWEMFGRGKLELFSGGVWEDKKYCIVCHHIEFEEKITIKTSDFLKYLDETNTSDNVPLSIYLSPYETVPIDATINVPSDFDTIDTSVPYATIFLYTKENSVNSIFVGYSAVGGAVGLGASLLLLVTAPVSVPTTAAAIVVGVGVSGGATGGGIAATTIGDGIDNEWSAGWTIYPYDTEALNKLDCDMLPASQDPIE